MDNFNNTPQNPYIKPENVGEAPASPTPVFCPVLSETDIETKNIKKKMTGIGITFLVVFVLMQLWVYPFIIIAQILGFSYESVVSLLQNEYFMMAVHVASSLACFTIPFIILAKAQKRTVSELVPLGNAKKGTALPFFFLGLSFCSLSQIFSSSAGNFFRTILSFFGLRYDLSSTSNEKGWLIFVLALISTAVVPALVEEFACRGVMLGLLKEHSEGFAVLVSAILFGIIHGNFVQIPFAFMVGLALAVIRLKTGTLWVAIAVHFCNNLVSVIFEYVLYNISQGLQNVIYFVYLLICLLLGTIGVLLLAKEKPEIFSLESNKNGISEKRLVTTALSRPMIIILISIYLLLSFSFITR